MTEPPREEVAEPPPGVGANPVEIAARLKRTFAMYRLYGVGHISAEGAEEQLFEKLTSYFATESDLAFTIEATSLKFGGKKILADDRVEESITRPLFTDGVQSITLHKELDKFELIDYLRIWNQALTGTLDAEHTFSTAVWEQDFDNISTVFKPGLAETGVDGADAARARQGRLTALMEAAQQVALPELQGESISVDANALAVMSHVDSFRHLRPEDLEAQASADRAPIPGLSRSEKQSLVSGLNTQDRGVGQRAIFSLWRAMPIAEPAEAEAIVSFLTRIIGTLMEEKRAEEVCRALLRVAEKARGSQEEADQLSLFLGCLSDPAVIRSLARLLEEAKSASSAVSLFSYLPSRFADRLLEPLAEAQGEARSRLVQVLISKRPAAEQIAGFIMDQGDTCAQSIFAAAEELGEEHLDLTIRASLIHDDHKVRLRGLNHIKTEAVPTYRTLVFECTSDPDQEVGQTALQTLIRARDPSATEILAEQLSRQDAPAEVRRICIRGLGSMGGPRACELLRQVFLEEKDRNLKKAAALALGSAKDQTAIDLLESEMTRFFADKTIKEACKEALRRIESTPEEA